MEKIKGPRVEPGIFQHQEEKDKVKFFFFLFPKETEKGH